MFLVKRPVDERISIEYLPTPAIHILLLGAGDVGKSTLFKQFTIIYGEGYSDDARRNFIDVVHHNVLTQAQSLIEFTRSLEPDLNICPSSRLFSNDHILPTHVQELRAILENDAVWRSLQKFRHRHSLEYFSSRLQEISLHDYIPSRADVLATRTRTLGLIDQHVTVNGARVKVTDTGGQRNERKKWWHVTDTASCAVFVLNLNGYILDLYEDTSQNCLKEDFAAFRYAITSPHCSHLPFLVLLNQKDMFQQTLQAEKPDPEGILQALQRFKLSLE